MNESNNIIIVEGRIPLTERNAFQTFLMEKMGVQHGNPKSQEKWMKYAKLVSNIIDDEKNTEIRSSIIKGNNEDASSLVLKALGVEEVELVHH